jgi:hypothetical protein
LRILAVHYSDNERLLPQSSGDAAGANAASRELRDRLIAVQKSTSSSRRHDVCNAILFC